MHITGSPGAFYYLPGSGLGTNKWVVYFQVSLRRPFCAPTPGPRLALCPPAATPHANHLANDGITCYVCSRRVVAGAGT